jgi:hypothetical protein
MIPFLVMKKKKDEQPRQSAYYLHHVSFGTGIIKVGCQFNRQWRKCQEIMKLNSSSPAQQFNKQNHNRYYQ